MDLHFYSHPILWKIIYIDIIFWQKIDVGDDDVMYERDVQLKYLGKGPTWGQPGSQPKISRVKYEQFEQAPPLSSCYAV